MANLIQQVIEKRLEHIPSLAGDLIAGVIRFSRDLQAVALYLFRLWTRPPAVITVYLGSRYKVQRRRTGIGQGKDHKCTQEYINGEGDNGDFVAEKVFAQNR